MMAKRVELPIELSTGSGALKDVESAKLPAWAAAWTGTYDEDMKEIEEHRKTNPNWGKISQETLDRIERHKGLIRRED